MKDTVKHLRDGWYGNYFGVGNPPDIIIKPENCKSLIENNIEAANEIFIPMCKDLGLTGTIGNLIHVPLSNSDEEGSQNFPIDLVVGNLGSIDVDSNDKD